jgi:hypothetical protein
MKIVTYLSVALAATILYSCKKGDDVPAEYKQKAEEFKTFVANKQFRLVDYYADKAIDYVEDDAEVKQETDLWAYVSIWIKDDLNVFDLSSNKVTVTQGEHKFEGITDDVFSKDFSIGADKDGPYLNFLNYQYNPLKYRILEFTDNHFIVYVDWHSGAKVFSEFEAVP